MDMEARLDEQRGEAESEVLSPPTKRAVLTTRSSRRPFSDITNLNKAASSGKGTGKTPSKKSSKAKTTAKSTIITKSRVDRKPRHPSPTTRVVATRGQSAKRKPRASPDEEGIVTEPPVKRVQVATTPSEEEEEETEAGFLRDVYEKMLDKQDGNRVDADYFDRQPRLNSKMRSILVDWLVDIHTCFQLHVETLYLAVNYIDRYLSVVETPREQLQLVGMTALLIASKFEEVEPLEIADVVQASGYTYTSDQTREMEQRMLQTLHFNLAISTGSSFLGYFATLVDIDPSITHLAAFFSQTALLHLNLCVTYSPAMLAASCLYLARCTIINAIPDDEWRKHFETSTRYRVTDLLPCLHELCKVLSSPTKNLMALSRKFASRRFSRVSAHAVDRLEGLLPSE